MTVRESHAHRSAPCRGDNPSRAQGHVAAGVPRDFVDVLARAPTLAAALALAVMALCIAHLVMPIDEEVPATRQRAPWPAAMLDLAMVIFAIAFYRLRHDKD